MNIRYFIKCLFVILNVIATSCGKDETFSIVDTKWKLESFYDLKNQTIDSSKPDNCTECYVINFEKNGLWQGHSSTNVLFGKYKIDRSTLKGNLNFTEINGTEINELFDGSKYMQMLKNVHSFELKNNQLKLFYDFEGNYLLFNIIS